MVDFHSDPIESHRSRVTLGSNDRVRSTGRQLIQNLANAYQFNDGVCFNKRNPIRIRGRKLVPEAVNRMSCDRVKDSRFARQSESDRSERSSR